MATLAIESNGLIEKTAVYYNGEQISGVKELFLSLDEDGTFDAFIQYEGSDNNLYTKQIFSDYLENIKIIEPTFTEEEALELHLLTIESNGDIDDTVVFYDEEPLEGIVRLFLHIKGTSKPSGFTKLFKSKDVTDKPTFKTEITFRNENDEYETETIF